MPADIPGGDFEGCKDIMMDERGHDEDSAESICGALQAEAKSDHGDPEALMDALQRGAGLIADVGVDLVSGVDVPAVDSKWVMTKSGGARRGHDFRAASPVLLSKEDTDQRIAYAAAMIPREPDKEGDVVATPTVETAAHDFLKQDGGVDTDHSLIDGEGEVVESWVLKEERTFDHPSGATETYGAGTWMVGIEWGAEAWDRIQAGELTGLSIYGMAEHVPLGKAAGCGCDATAKDLTVPYADEVIVDLVYGAKDGAEKAAEAMGMDAVAHEHTLDGDTVWMPGPDHETYVEVYNEIAEGEGTVDASIDKEDPCWEGYTMVGTDENGDPRCVPDDDVPDANLENAVVRTADMDGPPATHKSDGPESDDMAPDTTGDGGGDASGDGDSTTDGGPDIGEVAASVDELAETIESVKEAVETTKQDDQEAAAMLAEDRGMEPGDILDILSVAEGKDPTQILDAVDEVEASAEESKESDGEMDDDEDEEEKATAEKRAAGANLGKGGDSTTTAAKGIDSDGGATGDTSWTAAKQKYAGDSQ